MKAFLPILLITLASIARADEAEIRKLFAQAGQSYDTGQFAQAAERYEQIVQQGYAAPALFFNLGNSYFKEGNVGRAVLNYRRAWMDTPRDTELSANLRFALENAGALLPPPSPLRHVLSRLSLKEWIFFSALAYWLGAACIIIYWIRAGRPRYLRRAAAVFALATLAGVAGIFNWLSYRWRPEAVVLSAGQQALFAPLENATPHFALPPGSIVRVEEQSGPWIKINSGKESGWIHQSACESVYSWQRRERE